MPINLNAVGADPDPDGRPAGFGQDHDVGQARRCGCRSGCARRCCWPAWTRSGRPRSCSCSNWPSAPASPACRSCRARRRCRSRARAMETGRREVFDVVILDTAGRLSIDEALMDEVAPDPRGDQPGRDAAGGRCDDRPGRGQHRQGVQRRGRRDRHRDDPDGRRCARRCGAVDARDHRRADQADRLGREAGRAGGFPSRARRRPHPGHGRHRRAGREGRRDDRPGGGREARQEDGEGQLRPGGLRQPSCKQISKMGSMSSHPGHAAGGREDAAAARGGRRANIDKTMLEPPGGDHRRR